MIHCYTMQGKMNVFIHSSKRFILVENKNVAAASF